MKRAWCVGCVVVVVVGASVPVEAIDPFRMAFVTSVQGGAVLGDASDWPDNDGLTGIAAADAICRNRAFAGGLLGWDQFRAWISTGVHDAYCRVHDAGGTIATTCGQPALPTGAGPWIRVDGLPWAARIEDALGLDGVVYRPLLDEFGNDFPIANIAASVWTGTGLDGAGTGAHCSGWTTTTGSAASGQPGNATTQNWGFNWSGGCSARRALLCLQTGAGPDIPIGADTGRLAFQTSARGTGELGTWPQAATTPGAPAGVDAGDAICRSLATDAGLPYADTFKAWLSTAAVDARDRFLHDGPWRRVDGVLVAHDLADLVDGSPTAPINVDERGHYDSGYTWTGTDNTGLGTTDTCTDWSDTAADADFGISAGTAGLWSKASPNTLGCHFSFALYCLSDSPEQVTWWDLFESGDLSWWSDVVP